MTKPLEHYGWVVSPYTAKTRSYLRYKRIPFEDIAPPFWTFVGRIKKAVGRPIMPTVRLPEGRWLQDSSVIIDHFEAEYPTPSLTPSGGAQRIASLLLELHGDEWLPMVALHYRWNLDRNRDFALDEFARIGLPWIPRALGRRLARPFADKMAGYLPLLGVTEATQGGVEAFTEALIAALDTHLSECPYLLGGRPCHGDFALFGPLWAHVFRDPGSTDRFDAAPAVRAWFERLLTPPATTEPFLANDAVSETLDPIFEILFREQWPYVEAVVGAVDAWCEENPEATRVKRAFGWHPFTVGGSEGERRLITFTHWKAQRICEAYGQLTVDERVSADTWLARVGGRGLGQLKIRHRQVFEDFKLRRA